MSFAVAARVEAAIELGVRKAVEANSAENWDALWRTPATSDWRPKAMEPVYRSILRILGAPPQDGAPILDWGGGSGHFAGMLAEEGWTPMVVDISAVACAKAAARPGVRALHRSLEQLSDAQLMALCCLARVAVGTEFLEHLAEPQRGRLLSALTEAQTPAIFSIPNDRLGPNEEAQHTIRFSAQEFEYYLRRWARNSHVLLHGPYLLGVLK